MSLARSLLAALAAGLTTACSVSVPLVVDSTSQGIPRSGSVAIALPEDEIETARGRFGASLSRAFTAEAYSIDPSGALIADYAIAISDASDGMLGGEPRPQGIEQDPDWIAEPRRPRNFDKCDAQRLRGTLVLFDRASSAVVYRGKASRIECEFSDADIAAMATALVRDALDLTPRPASD